MNEQPDSIIYKVTFDQEKKKPIWTKVGVAYSHIDDEGHDLHFKNMVTPGILVMRKNEKNQSG